MARAHRRRGVVRDAPRPAASTRIAWDPTSLTVEWSDGTVGEFASIWLRDNRSGDRDPHSGQRLIDIADLPPEPRIRSAAANGGEVLIEWDGEPGAAAYCLDWLAAHAAGADDRHPERRAQAVAPTAPRSMRRAISRGWT